MKNLYSGMVGIAGLAWVIICTRAAWGIGSTIAGSAFQQPLGAMTLTDFGHACLAGVVFLGIFLGVGINGWSYFEEFSEGIKRKA